MIRPSVLGCAVFFGMGAAAFACGGRQPPKEPMVVETIADAGPEDVAQPEPPKSLFERLGGKPAIAAIVDALIKNLTSNDVTKKRFAKIPKDRAEKMRNLMIDRICNDSGGDCEYTGKSMKDAHKGMKITEAEWNATVSALKAALEETQIAENEQNDLVFTFGAMKDDIVEAKPKPAKK